MVETLLNNLGLSAFSLQGFGPLMHVIAGKAVAFKEALSPEFVEYQKQVIKNGTGFGYRPAAIRPA